jgi:hypothetical protein
MADPQHDQRAAFCRHSLLLRLLPTASLLGATGCSAVAIIWKRVLFSKRKETRQGDGDQTKGEAGGEGTQSLQCRRPLAPKGQPYLPGRIVTSRASTATTDPITLCYADQLDVGRPNHGSVLLRIGAATAALGATTLLSADAMRHSTFDAEVSVSYVLEHHALGIEK